MIVSSSSYRNMSLLCGMLAFLTCPHALKAQRQMELLGRGVVAVRVSSTQTHASWRMLGTDPDDIGFNLYRSSNGGAAVKINGSPLTSTTDFMDTPPSLGVPIAYSVRPVIDGIEGPPGGFFTVPANASIPTDHQNNVAPYLSIPLQIPPGATTPDGTNYTYSANDGSIGDLDGDGEYEYILKWYPSNSHDNAHDGYTGNVFLDAYELDGTRLWRIDLGINIRAGAHYTQFMVYDLDGDGRAEVVCKTAEGARDGLGTYVANNAAKFAGVFPSLNNAADHRNASGRILRGYELLTVFRGDTGEELATTYYNPPRNNSINSEDVSAWGDNYGNRVDRFLACVAYLDGVRPSVVMCRGYYTRAVLAAWDWRDGQLTQRWVFDSADGTPGNSAYEGQGNHNLSVGDVDGDGKDEIIYGACSIDDDGTGLYTTGLHHGDALHVSDMDPDRPGLEVWDIHEVPGSAGGGELRNARTGSLIYGIAGTGDTGRGLAAHIDSGYVGYQMWSSASPGVLDRTGDVVSASKPSVNFAVWWDADLQRELQDSAGGGGGSSKLDKWTGNGATRILSPYSVDGGASNINGTKANPCLSGDLLGDWREEMLFRSSDNTKLMMFIPIAPANNRFRTFLHDAQYRLALAWQNTAYNQPPHPSFYVGEGMAEPPLPLISGADRVWLGDGADNLWDVAVTDNWRTNGMWTNRVPTAFLQNQSVLFDLTGSNTPAVRLEALLEPEAVTVHSPTDYTFTGNGSLAGTMTLKKAGTGTLTVNTTNSYNGPTVVSEGVLLVNGRLDESAVTVKRGVWLASAIGGTGILGQGVVVESGGGVIPGNGMGSAGTLTISNSLVESGGAVNFFDLSEDPAGASNDRVDVVGDLTLSGVNRIRINPLNGSLAFGTYELIRYGGSFNGSLANLTVDALPGYSFFLSNPSGEVRVTVTEARIAQPVTLVDADAVWLFRDDAVDLGTLWRTNTYDEAGWASGPPELGFGDGDETTPVTDNDQWTTYFRHTFDVPAAHLVESLTARLKRDDGAVVYLNGVEVWRSNMPQGGEILYTTPAAGTVANSGESAWYTNSISPAGLRDGANLLAAEVHQIGLTSSDITFHLELSGAAYPPDAPVLSASGGAEGMRLSWPTTAGALALYGTTNLTSPVQWLPVGTAPVATNGEWVVLIPPTNGPMGFFQLQAD